MIPVSIEHAADSLSLNARLEWVPTSAVTKQNVEQVLGRFDGIFGAPGSPYESFDGALATIEFARTRNRPYFGSCAGFQHALIEYARNVMGIADAHSAEYGTDSKNIVVTPVSCPVPNRPAGQPRLSGAVDCTENRIRIKPETRAFRIYQREGVLEEYFCNYEANLAFQSRFDAAGLRISGFGPGGEARIVEFSPHRFFLATLFQPMRATAPGRPHPLIVSYLQAAAQYKRAKESSGAIRARA